MIRPGRTSSEAKTEPAFAAHVEVVSNVWYGELVGAEQIGACGQSQLAAVLGSLRLFIRSRRSRAVITSEGTLRPLGLVTLASLLAVTRRRKLILVEFLPGRKRGFAGRLVEIAYRAVLHRTCLGVHVLTAGEGVEYQRRYGLDPGTVRHIPFYYLDDRVGVEPVPAAGRRGIVASGRNSCDWKTLIDAADGQNWPLTIICPATDRPAIADSARRAGVHILTDLPRAEHDGRLGAAQLFLAVMKDQGGSSGHVRLASAAARETPLIASAIPGIRGYESLAVQTVPPEDASALRAAINAALLDPVGLRQREEDVLRVAATRPFAVYTGEVAHFIEQVLPADDAARRHRIRPTRNR